MMKLSNYYFTLKNMLISDLKKLIENVSDDLYVVFDVIILGLPV